jgi:hypothetical protein
MSDGERSDKKGTNFLSNFGSAGGLRGWIV